MKYYNIWILIFFDQFPYQINSRRGIFVRHVPIKIDRFAVIMTDDIIGHPDGDPFATNESIEGAPITWWFLVKSAALINGV